MSYNFSKFKQRSESDSKFYIGETKEFKNYKKLLSEEEITEEYNKMTDKICTKPDDKECHAHDGKYCRNAFQCESMTEKIQMTEEQFEKVVRDCYPYDLMESNFIDKYKQKAKEKGYIRKSAVEEVEEMYKDYQNKYTDMEGEPDMRDDVIEKFYKAIQELKAENERLKKCK